MRSAWTVCLVGNSIGGQIAEDVAVESLVRRNPGV
jgi:hypothetical protein